jgi:hypothetical protein
VTRTSAAGPATSASSATPEAVAVAGRQRTAGTTRPGWGRFYESVSAVNYGRNLYNLGQSASLHLVGCFKESYLHMKLVIKSTNFVDYCFIETEMTKLDTWCGSRWRRRRCSTSSTRTTSTAGPPSKTFNERIARCLI